MTLLPAFLTATALILQGGGEAPGPALRLADDGAFEVAGLTSDILGRLGGGGPVPADLLTVAVEGTEIPMLGRVRVAGDVLRFEPRYPIRPGTRYRATFRPARLPGGDPDAVPVEATLAAPDPDAEPSRVVAAYPSADRLPENLLRFYLHFSAPMSRGEAYRRIRLVGPGGSPVVAPFLELDEELWDPSGTRLTLLIDPGRIKQGLVPREQLGPVLESGREYTLEVDPEWPDAAGRPLSARFSKSFRTEAADNSPPDPDDWRLDPPPPGTRNPLVVAFPGPLDHALLGRLLRVAGPDGQPVAGRAEVEESETRWSFTPDAPWAPGDFRLIADTDLEDLAGNGIGRPFEVDVFDRVAPRVEAREVAVPFRIGPG